VAKVCSRGKSLLVTVAKSTRSVCNHLINLNIDGTEINVLDLYDILMISIYLSGPLALPGWNELQDPTQMSANTTNGEPPIGT